MIVVYIGKSIYMRRKFAALLIALDNYSTHVEYNGVTNLRQRTPPAVNICVYFTIIQHAGLLRLRK